MQYHADEMRDILDNLVVWDREKKVHYGEIIKYKEVKHRHFKGSCSMFTITALKEPLLVFYTIGELVERRINRPVDDNGPQQIINPIKKDKKLEGLDFNYIFEKVKKATGKTIKIRGLVYCDDDINECDFCLEPTGCTLIIDGYTLKPDLVRTNEDFYICKKCVVNKK